jgi:hypothetical protein
MKKAEENRGGGERPLTSDKASQRQMMNTKQRRRFLTLTGAMLLVTAVLVLPGAAMAQDQLANPSAAQYQPQSSVLGSSTSGTSSPSVASTPSGGNGNSRIGSLPFTGMDLAIVAGVALLLTGTGLALHRLSVPPRPRG